MDRPAKRRFQFGLRTLLVVVVLAGAASAVATRVYREIVVATRIVPQEDVDRVTVGMTQDQVRAIVGWHGRGKTVARDGHEFETWAYGLYDVTVEFKDGKVISIERS